MTTSRREFLKIAGASTLSLIVPAIVCPAWAKEKSIISGGGSPEAWSPLRALKAKRWAMSVDPSKCPPDCFDCITACHRVHNVPDFGNLKDEVKWIWQEKFAAAFPNENHSYLQKSLQQLRLPVLCNHCANPACVAACPTEALRFASPAEPAREDAERFVPGFADPAGCRPALRFKTPAGATREALFRALEEARKR